MDDWRRLEKSPVVFRSSRNGRPDRDVNWLVRQALVMMGQNTTARAPCRVARRSRQCPTLLVGPADKQTVRAPLSSARHCYLARWYRHCCSRRRRRCPNRCRAPRHRSVYRPGGQDVIDRHLPSTGLGQHVVVQKQPVVELEGRAAGHVHGRIVKEVDRWLKLVCVRGDPQ